MPPIAPIVEDAASFDVTMVIAPVVRDAGLQVVGGERRVEVVQRRDLTARRCRR